MIRHENVILLVEDDPADVELTRRAVAEAALASKVRVAPDAGMALDYLRGRGAFEGRDPRRVPALVLLGLALPDPSGFELLTTIRAEETTRHVPVVVLARAEDDQHLNESYDVGANSCVRKPTSVDEFVEAVRELALYWLVINEKPHPDE